MDIILIEPQNPGNIGAIARSMKNFGFEQLVLVNPCKLTQEARNRAKHAQEILDNSIILSSFNELKYDLLIGTTAITGKDYNLIRSPMLPDELELEEGKIGLVFGREDTGLRNEELSKLDFAVRIPTNDNYPTLNLSHAATILMYEFTKKELGENLRDKHKLASLEEKEVLMKVIENIISNTSFRAEHEADTQRKVWKKIIGKGMLTKREMYALIGFMKRER
ncbi:MAG: RNA methyltransferase [Candidatus Woesearchaeota archaeon]